MRWHIPKAYYFPAALVVGLLVGYGPAIWYFQPGKSRIATDGAFIDTSYTVLRGVLTGVDLKSKTLHVTAVSPYTLRESAPFNIRFDEKTTFFSAPTAPGYPTVLLPTSRDLTSSPDRLAAGTPIVVRLSRKSGTLRAQWISAPTLVQ